MLLGKVSSKNILDYMDLVISYFKNMMLGGLER